jgi:hypothetical protein
MGKKAADVELAAKLASIRAMQVPGKHAEIDVNHTLALNLLDFDLGRHPDIPPNDYGLDQRTRDRLLVHARQDAAETLLHAITALDEIHRLKRSVKIAASLVFASLAVLLISVWWSSIIEWLHLKFSH